MGAEVEELFRGRAPEAAARQVATVLATATEYHLATLETMQAHAKTSKSSLKRQGEICRELVAQCEDLGIAATGLRGNRCLRLMTAIGALRNAASGGSRL